MSIGKRKISKAQRRTGKEARQLPQIRWLSYETDEAIEKSGTGVALQDERGL